MDAEQIISILEKLPLKEVLKYLAVKGIFDLTKKGYESIRKLVQEKASEKRYGFVPNKDESNYLIKVKERPYYVEFSTILPNHRYSDFIRTGYLISHLNKIGGEEKRGRVKEIRESVYQRPNGEYLLKIVNLVTTGAIVPVINYLNELKKRNYDADHLTNFFDEIISNWERLSYFVKADTEVEKIFREIKMKIDKKQNIIMIFSYGSAKDKATKAVAKILNGNHQKGYFYDSKNNWEGEKEVHTSTFTLLR